MSFIKGFVIFTILGVCAVQAQKKTPLNCGGHVVPLPFDTKGAVEKCEAESIPSCVHLCAYKRISFITKANKVYFPMLIRIGRAVPEELKGRFIAEGIKCGPFIDKVSTIDPDCSNFDPFYKCVAGAIAGICDVTDDKLFSLKKSTADRNTTLT